MYALAVVAGAFANSTIGKAFDGQKLLFLCALLMLVVGVLMLRGRGKPGNLDVQCRRENALKVIAYGSATGLFLGFLGIGGGFLIAPGLMAATGLPMIHGVGSSLVAAFGLTTAINYAASGFIDWGLARRSGAAACLAAWSERRHRSISWCTRDCSTACSRR
jgi:hypothetical protein